MSQAAEGSAKEDAPVAAAAPTAGAQPPGGFGSLLEPPRLESGNITTVSDGTLRPSERLERSTSRMPESIPDLGLRTTEIQPQNMEIGKMYSFEEKLGEGAFGTVWKCIHHQTKKEVAIKSIPLSSPQVAEDTERELNVFKKLNNAHIAKLLEVFKVGEILHLVMEFCCGGNLLNYLESYWSSPEREGVRDMVMQSGRPLGLPDKEVARCTWQMMVAVAYMHHHRFVHRDIKTDNFMLQDDGRNADLKLIDFGLSCRFRKGEKLTRPVGTPRYLAPEVIQGLYNEKVDIWSIGVTSYLLSTRRFPWAGTTEEEICKNIVNDIRDEDAENSWACLPKELRGLVDRLMTRDPAKRPGAKQIVSGSSWLKTNAGSGGGGCCAIT